MTAPVSAEDLSRALGGMDIYLLDQLLRGRIRPDMDVLDVGCGSGRNLHFFLQAGYRVSGMDRDPDVVEELRRRWRAEEARFWVGELESLSGEAVQADLVVCNAVLHFARNRAHFEAMLRGGWAAVRSGGLFFARLASSIGLEADLADLGDGRYLLPDGSERFLVDEDDLVRATDRLGAELLDPIKTTNVQNLRCMTTWVLRKP